MGEHIPSSLSSLLLRSRKRAELTQEELAERSGVSVNTISNLEAGKNHLPRQSTLDLLAHALAVAAPLTPQEHTELTAAFKAAAIAWMLQQQTQPLEELQASPRTPIAITGSVSFLVCGPVPEYDRRVVSERPHQFVSGASGARVRRLLAEKGALIPEQSHGLDVLVAVFSEASTALATADALLRAQGDSGVEEALLCIALHTGWARPGEGDYAGASQRRALRLFRMGHAGQCLISRDCREQVRHTLPEGLRLREIGIYSMSAVERPQPIYQVQRAGQAVAYPPVRSVRLPPTNLPLQPTSLIGREPELATVETLMDKGPLVTLVGAGGCGKTRLAIQIGADLLDTYPDGVWLVELAAVLDPAVVSESVAAVLQIREAPGRPILSTVLNALKSRHLLIVLDNCEHLLESCAEFASSILGSCPHVQVLATSRQRLGIRGEQIYRVPSLALPGPDTEMAVHDLQRYEGVRLFVERAQLSVATFALTAENAQIVARICARLAGLPLAIELAAARVSTLPLEHIASRLEQSLGILTGGPRDVLPRHQTLQAALDWSWVLLEEREQVLLSRLAVFAGGWSANAARTVCEDQPPHGAAQLHLHSELQRQVHSDARLRMADDTASALLVGLTEKSLVVVEEQEGEARYWLLDTVRHYALEHLRTRGEDYQFRLRHATWCLSLAELADTSLAGPEQHLWQSKLAREHDNVRAALASAGALGEHDLELRLAGAMWRFWQRQGFLTEGRRRLEDALQGVHGTPSARARAMTGAGTLAFQQGDYRRAESLHQEALNLYQALGDEQGIAASLLSLGNVTSERGGYQRAAELYADALARHQDLGDRRGIATALNNLGIVSEQLGDYARAVAAHEQSLELRRTLGDDWGTAISLNNLGVVVKKQGNYQRAVALYQEALTVQRRLGDDYGAAASLDNLGSAAYMEGDFGRAKLLLEESLVLARKLGDSQGAAATLGSLGVVACAMGDFRTAGDLLEEGLALQRELGDTRSAARSLHSLGVVRFLQRDNVGAHALFEQGLMLSREIGARDLASEGVEAMAWLALEHGQPRRAAQLAGAAAALRDALGVPLPPEARASHEKVLRGARESLGEATFAEVWAIGTDAPYDEALALALASDAIVPRVSGYS